VRLSSPSLSVGSMRATNIGASHNRASTLTEPVVDLSAQRHVRFSPKNGQVQCTRPCLPWARNGLMHPSKKRSLFDHLVGNQQDFAADCQAQVLCSFKIYDELNFGRLLHRYVRRFGSL